MKTQIIAPDKTFNYKIPFLERSYVRTGVLADGSCFFHSYLRAFDFKYRSKPPAERKKDVQKMREKLANNLSISNFKELSGGEHRKMLFFGALRQSFESSDTVLPPQKLTKILEVATTYEESFYNTFIQEALKEEELVKCSNRGKQRFVDEMKKCFHQANQSSLQYLKNQLLHEEIGSVELEYIARQLKCNFIFLYETERGVERYPFSTIVDKKWPFCILLWVGEKHYEIIGRKEENSIITRIFYEDDEIVQHYASQNDLEE